MCIAITYIVIMQMKLRIRDLQTKEKPRERLVEHGPGALTDAELLAIILRSGGAKLSSLDLANYLLRDFNGLKGLMNTRYEELVRVKDMGPAKATCIKALAEIVLRVNFAAGPEKVKIHGPKDVFEHLRKDVYGLEKEHLYLLILDSRNYLISKELISIGTVNETLIHPREIYREAIYKNATSVILAHNHPSGDTAPSEDDIRVTGKIAEIGRLLSIPLIDHIVLSNDSYTSLKARNLFSIEHCEPTL